MSGKSNRTRRVVSRQAKLEVLEARRLLAGNVLAAQWADHLILDGDDLGNEIMVRSGNLPDVVIVQSMNQTTVNGTTSPWVFMGVKRITATFDGGNDWFKSNDLNLSGVAVSRLDVDGGRGDDRIEMKNTTIRASHNVRVTITGDRGVQVQPNTGNDSIQLANTTILARGGDLVDATVEVFGELDIVGQVTGGNDSITVTDTYISASNALEVDAAFLDIQGDSSTFGFGQGGTIGGGNDTISVTNTTVDASDAVSINSSAMRVLGDNNSAGGGVDRTIGGGNDSISVTNTVINATGGLNRSEALVLVAGDVNQALGFDLGEDSTATIGGGNDSITVTNTFITATGGDLQDSSFLSIAGDDQLAMTTVDVATTATVGGGNDLISVDNIQVTATGGTAMNSAGLEIVGDLNHVTSLSPLTRAATGGGNDRISVTNSTIEASGSGGDLAGIIISGDRDTNASASSPPGQREDEVVMRNVEVSGDAGPVTVDTGLGDDTLDVQNSFFHTNFVATLQDGNDVAKFIANTCPGAQLDGGPGHDILSAHNNIGALTHSNFEEVNESP